MKRRIVSALSAATAIAGVSLFAAPGTSAAVGDEVTPAITTFNVYQHDNYSGGYYKFTGQDCNWQDNYWTNAGGAVDGGTSSMKNDTNRSIVMYDDPGCAGTAYYAQPKSWDGDLTNNGFDNMASAADWL